MKIRLKCAWSKAKTSNDGIIVGWDDYAMGDTIDINDPIPLNPNEYENIDEKANVETLPRIPKKGIKRR